MSKIDLGKYGIKDVKEIVYNPSYELLFEEEMKKELTGYEKGQLTELASLALPLEGNFECVFEGFDKASFKAVPGGWTLTLNGRTLNVGDGKWAVTSWKFDDTNVEPPFVNCGTHDIAAAGRLLPNGSLSVTWQFLGGIRHGRFRVEKERQEERSR